MVRCDVRDKQLAMPLLLLWLVAAQQGDEIVRWEHGRPAVACTHRWILIVPPHGYMSYCPSSMYCLPLPPHLHLMYQLPAVEDTQRTTAPYLMYRTHCTAPVHPRT